MWLAGRQVEGQANPGFIERCRQAQATVTRRPLGVNQEGAFADLPADVAPHIEALRQDAISANVLATSGNPKPVDLSKVCAAQPQIHIEEATRRVEGVNPDDFAAIARISLPLPTPEKLPVFFDVSKQAWLISSPNPNLRVVCKLGRLRCKRPSRLVRARAEIISRIDEHVHGEMPGDGPFALTIGMRDPANTSRTYG